MAEIIDCTKCAFYNNGKCDNQNGMSCNCINNAVCYFKELKRLQQDYVILSKSFEHLKTSYQENQEYFLQLKAENERLKSEVGKLTQTCGSLLNIQYALADSCKKYSETLQEIKNIAEELSCKHPEECFENKPDWNGEVYGCNVADNWKNPSELATCPSKLASAILQIITKAEEE